MVAGALILVAGRVHALGDMGRLAMKVVVELRCLPVEPILLVADPLNRLPHDLLDLVASARSPAMRVLEAILVIDRPAADFSAEDNSLRRHHGLARHAGFRIFRKEKVYN